MISGCYKVKRILEAFSSLLYLDAPWEFYHVFEMFHSRKVSVSCPQCQGERVNWHESFSVGASCEGCSVSPKNIQYTWSLFLVNASSKPVTQGKKKMHLDIIWFLRKQITWIVSFSILVPFCYTVDVSAPSSIVEGSAISPLTPGTSTHYPPAPGASQCTHTVCEYMSLACLLCMWWPL